LGGRKGKVPWGEGGARRAKGEQGRSGGLCKVPGGKFSRTVRKKKETQEGSASTHNIWDYRKEKKKKVESYKCREPLK